MVKNTVARLYLLFVMFSRKKKTVVKSTVVFAIQHHTVKTGPKKISSAESLLSLLIMESFSEFFCLFFSRNFLIIRIVLVSSNPSFILSYTDM